MQWTSSIVDEFKCLNKPLNLVNEHVWICWFWNYFYYLSNYHVACVLLNSFPFITMFGFVWNYPINSSFVVNKFKPPVVVRYKSLKRSACPRISSIENLLWNRAYSVYACYSIYIWQILWLMIYEVLHIKWRPCFWLILLIKPVCDVTPALNWLKCVRNPSSGPPAY